MRARVCVCVCVCVCARVRERVCVRAFVCAYKEGVIKLEHLSLMQEERRELRKMQFIFFRAFLQPLTVLIFAFPNTVNLVSKWLGLSSFLKKKVLQKLIN